MIDHKTNHMIINQMFILLKSIHETFFTDPVDPSRYSDGFLINIIQSSIGKNVYYDREIPSARSNRSTNTIELTHLNER